MNLYLRLIWTLLRAWRMPKIAFGQTLERSLTVLPSDLDINGHMNNGRYLTIIDLMLVEYFVRTGYAAVMLKKGWRPMAGGSFITYRRGLQPFESYTLRFKLDASAEVWNFMRFEFSCKGKLSAAGCMKGAAVSKQGLVPNALAYDLLGLEMPIHALPTAVSHWLNAEAELMKTPWDFA